LSTEDVKGFLEEKVLKYNQPGFISDDPISIPHSFIKKQDIEISGLFAAVLAWGQRKTILKKCNELMQMMDNTPHAFVLDHSSSDLKPLLSFKHRTFNATDTLYFVHWLKWYYTQYDSLEEAFCNQGDFTEPVGNRIAQFYQLFFSLEDYPSRTKKHVQTPVRKSACKRINMFLRWMVRVDDKGVDFGIWNNIPMSELICPLDLHVDRVARKLGLIQRKQTDWQTAIELTERLRLLDPNDPVKYDFALFGLGVEEKF
jgi:uncharacterized protein (TIGR02757 family)